MQTVTVAFANVYHDAADADFLVIWNSTDCDLRGYVPLMNGTPRVWMSNSLELIRESQDIESLGAKSFVIRNPSHLDAAIGVLFYETGSPDVVPKTESLELFQNGVKVQARIHIFPAPLPQDCAVVIESTPTAQWQSNTKTERNYKHVETFPSKIKVEDWACAIC